MTQSTEQILARQELDAARQRAEAAAAHYATLMAARPPAQNATPPQQRPAPAPTAPSTLPVTAGRNATAVAVPDSRTAVAQWLDDNAQAGIIGPMIKFDKNGTYKRQDTDEVIGDGVDFIALLDQTLVGLVKFHGPGQPPDRQMGLLYGGFVMPDRESLGDTDKTQWETGLDGKPADPWQSHATW